MLLIYLYFILVSTMFGSF